MLVGVVRLDTLESGMWRMEAMKLDLLKRARAEPGWLVSSRVGEVVRAYRGPIVFDVFSS